MIARPRRVAVRRSAIERVKQGGRRAFRSFAPAKIVAAW
jgi:hypothetical protein